MMDRRVDLAVSLVVALLGAVVLVAAQSIPLGMINDPVGPRGFPTYLGALFLVAGLGLSVRRLRGWDRTDPLVDSEGKEDDDPDHPGSPGRAMAVVTATAVYALVLPPLGYIVATLAFVPAVLWLMGVTDWKRVVAVTVGYTVVTFVLFALILSVRLPEGILAGALDAVGLS